MTEPSYAPLHTARVPSCPSSGHDGTQFAGTSVAVTWSLRVFSRLTAEC